MRVPCPRWCPLALLLACVRAPAPTPAPAPAPALPQPVPDDRSEATGREGQLSDPEEAPAPAPAPPAGPVPLAAVTLTADAGLRLLHEGRGWDFAVGPGRVVTLAEDFQHLTAVDAETGKPAWRVQAQTQPNGRHTLHLQGERLILHAGPSRVHLDLRSGAIVGRASAFFNGSDQHCGLRIREGDTEPEWGGWIRPHAAGAACAESCECSLRLFACGDGAAVGGNFRASETHLYHSLSEPHDTVCFNRPALLLRGAAATIVRVEDDQDQPVIAGLDPATGATLWQRRELAEAVSAYLSGVGTDPAGKLCWLADASQLVVIACATGTTQWRLRLGDAEASGYTDITWLKGQLLVQHRDAVRTQLSLHDAAGGARRWQRRLPADRMVLPAGQGPAAYAHGGAPVAAYTIVDPDSGASRGEIAVVPEKQTLRRAPTGEYLRLGGAALAEFSAAGAPLRERTLATEHLRGVTAQHLVILRSDELRLLRRDTLQPVLTLAGSWSVKPSEAALGPAALVLTEHRGSEPGRVLLLRP